MSKLDDVLSRLGETALSTTLRESSWIFPTLETVHVLGLALVLGTVVVFDLRLLGASFVRVPVRRVATAVLPWSRVGFALAVATGVFMFLSAPGTYWANLSFRVKFALLAAAGLNILVFERFTFRSVARWDEARRPPWPARLAGSLSLALWLGVVAAGRWIAFIGR